MQNMKDVCGRDVTFARGPLVIAGGGGFVGGATDLVGGAGRGGAEDFLVACWCVGGAGLGRNDLL